MHVKNMLKLDCDVKSGKCKNDSHKTENEKIVQKKKKKLKLNSIREL